MIVTNYKRGKIITEFLSGRTSKLLDVGSGPVDDWYTYAPLADSITCIDWNMRRGPNVPDHVTTISGDFFKHDFRGEKFDVILATDVFEHLLIEDEETFVARCRSLLKPGGRLIISVPHAGTFAWLDPFKVKPAVHRVLAHMGLYRNLHNGSCDIRKGHKHYTEAELVGKFAGFSPEQVNKYGRLYEPLGAWADALSRRGVPMPVGWLNRKIEEESEEDVGSQAYSMMARFRESTH